MVSFMHFNPGKKILWGTWIGHLGVWSILSHVQI